MSLLRRALPLALLAACQPDKDGMPAEGACERPAPELARIDVPAGYTVLDAPVEAPWLTEPRSVPVGMWYPTDATEGEAATYLDAFVDERSLVDATFADPDPACKLPLVVYSHGSQAWGGNNSPLLRHLVAQGWVAAAPDHLDNTLADNVDPRPVSFSRTRVADVVAAIDAVEALPEGHPLHGRVDTSTVVVLGHSFGGQTAWLMAGPTFDADTIAARCAEQDPPCTQAELDAYAAPATDPRVVAVMPMDGFAGDDLVNTAGWESADRPVLYLSKAEEGDTVPIETAAAADVIWGRFDGACHETFTASPVNCSTWEKEDGWDDVAQFLTAWVARHQLGLDGAPWDGVLDGSTVVDKRITITTTR